MTGLKLELSDEQMRQALSAALLASLDDGAREKIIAQAIEFLTTEPKAEYGRQKLRSPLQEGFENALRIFATEWARELVNEDPAIKQAFREVFKETALSIIENKESIGRRVVEAMANVSIKVNEY